MPNKKETVLQDLINAVEFGVLIPSIHALEQMVNRGITMSDIEEVVYRAYREDHKDSLNNDGNDGNDWKYAVRGLNDNGGKDIRIIVAYLDEPKMLLITAIDKNK